MREMARDYAGLAVTEMARTVCELLDWKRANGRLKDQECRQLLERLRDQGWLTLPPVRNSGPRGPRHIPLTEASAPQATTGRERGRVRTAGVASRRESKREPIVDRADRTASLLGAPRTGGSESALSGVLATEWRTAAGLFVVVFSGLEDGPTRSVDWMERKSSERRICSWW